VLLELDLLLEEVKTKGTDKQNFAVVLLRERTVIPGLDDCVPETNPLDRLNFSRLVKLLDDMRLHAVVHIILHESELLRLFLRLPLLLVKLVNLEVYSLLVNP
jgi:hypothetical protein